MTNETKLTAIDAYQHILAGYESAVNHCLDVIRNCDDPDARMFAAVFLRALEGFNPPRRAQ